ncbi:MAG: response regulator [Alphaproteobacteria bacterium]|nr:response regulator [Alphaproteobacteria bacterium]
MNTRYKLITGVFNYVPGFIILIFGMLALHSTMLLISDYEGTFSFFDPKAWMSHRQEMQLYWSVIAIGLSGFVLTVLNSDKLRALKKINDEKKQTLKLLEDRLAAMEATHDGIGIVDSEGHLAYMNKAFKTLHGIEDTGNYIGQHWSHLYEGHDHISKEALSKLEEQSFWCGTMPIMHGDGKIVHAELSLAQLPDGGFIGTARDVTAQHLSAMEKAQLQEQFYQAQKMEAVGRLAGGIAHDFNNILAAINGYAEFLVEDIEPENPSRQFAVNILQAGQQARSLVDQILAFSRRKTMNTERMDIVQPLRESLSMLEASLPKSIDVVTDIRLEHAPVTGNATQISQVIMNLCVNAKDAMAEDKGELRLSLKKADINDYRTFDIVGASASLEQQEEGEESNLPIRIDDVSPGRSRLFLGHFREGTDYVCLNIIDTGSGMSRAIMERIFEPFFTTKPVEQGTGLGLATVHGVLTVHKGVMIIDSMIGQGTSFEIFLPMLKDEEASRIVDLPHAEDGNGSGRVLLVEDQPHVADMLVNMLERLGYEAHACKTGLEALDVLRETPGAWDLVITDQNMPKMTGLELVVQAHLDFPELPFILLSGYSEEKLQELMEKHPAIKAILRKPVSKPVLAQTIKAVLSSSVQKETSYAQA